MSLRTYLTEIADAIREKKGTTDPINAQSFANEIKSLSSGNPFQEYMTAKGNRGIFNGCTTLTTSSLENIIKGVDFSAVTQFDSFFANCQELTYIPDTVSFTNATNLQACFEYCYKLTSIPQSIKNIVFSNLTYSDALSQTFRKCYALTETPELNITGYSGNLNGTFYQYGANLNSPTIPAPILDTSSIKSMTDTFQKAQFDFTGVSYDCSNCTTLQQTFYECKISVAPQLTNIKVCAYFNYLFGYCYNLTDIEIDLSQNNPSSGPYYYNMFASCRGLLRLKLKGFKNSEAYNASGMFQGCRRLVKLILTDITSVPLIYSSTLDGCYHFTGAYDATYNPDRLKDALIYVPDDLVDSFKSATNWSTYADIIVPLSTLVE